MELSISIVMQLNNDGNMCEQKVSPNLCNLICTDNLKSCDNNNLINSA